VLRSPHPHARIRKIDLTRAKALEGVKAIITRDNCETVWSSGDTANKRYLFNNPVRFVGDAVAAVAAVDRHTADEAIRLIDVEYDVLPFVLDMEDALRPGAPEIQPGGNMPKNNRGQAAPDVAARGKVEDGFKSADKIIEGSFSTVHHNNAQMEPRVSIATWSGNNLTVYAATQGGANCRTDIAKDMALPVENVRVLYPYMGGGFGNKNQCQDSDLMAAVLSKTAGAPVKIEFTRKEDFVSVHGRWPTKQHYKIGVKNDGTLTAIQLKATSGLGPYRKSAGSISGIEIYQCPHTEQTTALAFTNMAVSANYRAPAYPQGVFALEGTMDDVAYAIGMDPLDFRLKNFTRKFRDQVPYSSSGLEDCLRRGADLFEWKKRYRAPGSSAGPIKRGVGMGMGMFGSALGMSAAILDVDASGKYRLFVGVTDIGTGAKTTMGLIAAEELGVHLSQVEVINGDTDTCPYSVGESGSRTTVQTGMAVVEAAKDLKNQMAAKGLPKGGDRLVAKVSPTPMQPQGVSRQSFVVHFAEVEVDTETGRARCTKFVAAHDSGRIINPLTATSQVKGGAIQGIGMALHEELLYDKRAGSPLTAGYYGARVMTHLDAPEIEVLWIETDDPYGPFGAKTLGEPTIIPTVAAVGNAVANAIGKRVRDLPITRDKILGVLA